MRRLVSLWLVAAIVVPLAGCQTVTDLPASSPVASPSVDDVEVVEVPVPVPTSVYTPLPTAPTVTLTLYGTDAIFSWTTGAGNMHQLQDQQGPYVIELPYASFGRGTLVNANVVTMNGDAGCKAVHGERVIVDNTAPGQTVASCLDTVH